jgi:hypothetical protein
MSVSSACGSLAAHSAAMASSDSLRLPSPKTRAYQFPSAGPDGVASNNGATIGRYHESSARVRNASHWPCQSWRWPAKYTSATAAMIANSPTPHQNVSAWRGLSSPAHPSTKGIAAQSTANEASK